MSESKTDPEPGAANRLLGMAVQWHRAELRGNRAEAMAMWKGLQAAIATDAALSHREERSTALTDAWFADLMNLHAACFKNEGEDADEALARMRALLKEARAALSHRSRPETDAELPGMWEPSDLSGGFADSTDALESGRASAQSPEAADVVRRLRAMRGDFLGDGVNTGVRVSELLALLSPSRARSPAGARGRITPRWRQGTRPAPKHRAPQTSRPPCRA